MNILSTDSKDTSNISRYGDKTNFFENLINDDRLLTKKEIADFLNVSVKMIDRKVSLNEIPFLKIGRLVRFRKRDVLAWAEGKLPKR